MRIFTLFTTFTFLLIFQVSAEPEKKLTLNAASTGLEVINKSPIHIQLKNSVSEISYVVISTEKGDFCNLQIKDYLKNYENTGNPNLPVLNKLIEIPYGAEVEIKIYGYDEEIISFVESGIAEKIIPVQPSYFKNTDPADIFFHYNEEAYQQDYFENHEVITVQFLGKMRGIQIARLTISPFFYNPVQNILKVYNNLEFEIIFKNADTEYTEYLKKTNYSPYFEAQYNQLLNYTPIIEKEAVTTYPITYIIVSDRMFETTLQTFIERKTKKGFKVITGYTDVIGATTTAIHNYIDNLYQTEVPKPTFVLFVGDVAQIPAYTGTTGSHPSDLYYCTFDGGSDYIPELYFGRFSAESTSELSNIIQKVLMHEQYLWPDESFLDKCVMVAGVDATNAPSYGNGQIYYGINEYFNTTNGYFNIYAYLYGSSTHPYQVMSSANAAASADIISKISTGVGFANYTAHCDETGWADPSFSTGDIATLANSDKYPLMIGNCCLSNRFNASDCFGEMIVYAQKKGASGYIGGSNNTLWDEDFYWSVGVNTLSITTANAELHNYSNTGRAAYDGVWHTHGEPTSDWFITAAEMNYYGNMAVESSGSGENVYYWEIYHLMGDPSMMAYLSIPTTLTVSYINPIVVGATSLTVNTEQYTYAAISQNGVLLDAEYSGTGTSVTLTFPAFTTPGQADIVVTKQNRKPYIGTVDIINTATDNDAMVQSIIVPAVNYECPQEVQPVIRIMNVGSIALSSVTVGYSLDNDTPVSINWTGNIAQYATADITFAAITFTQGAYQCNAFTANPNGVADEYPDNDTLIKYFTVNNLVTIADFTSDDSIFCSAPATVNFANLSLNADTYKWNFGDEATSTDQAPTHTYSAEDNYTVTLIAYNGI
ncbi:MAG: PKD domain-containing protein, partial [Bacteroidia bacterium]|nr:PKD domain-containing protein [Bacteroidia bacterium]